MKNEQIYISAYFPEVARAGSFLLEDILKIAPNIFESIFYESISEDFGRVEKFGKRFFGFGKYFLSTTKGKKVLLDFCRRDNGEKIILSLPSKYGFTRDLLEEAYDGEMRGKV